MAKYFRTNIDAKVGDYVTCEWLGFNWVSPVKRISTANYSFPVAVVAPKELKRNDGSTIDLSMSEVALMSDDEVVEYLLSNA